MKIAKVTLTNIRCFKNIQIDLRGPDGIKNFMLVLGDNSFGKTTILRSIALGLCEESGASGLLSEGLGDMIRYGSNEGVIKLEVMPYDGYNDLAYIETTLKRNDYNEIELSQKVLPEKPESFAWEKLFACGYGVGRGVFGTEDVSEYAVTDSVYSLFNYKSELQNPELVLRRINSEMEIDGIFRKLEGILMLPENSVMLTRSGITIKDFWGKDFAYGTMGDGYASTLTWIMDMYGWKLLYEKDMHDLQVNGIVIIDELENHLHPKWQKQIIKLLSQHFPGVQFIISTHSSLCVIGTTDLRDDECSISVLTAGEESVDLRMASPPRGMRADQVLTSYLFDLYTTSDDTVKNAIEKYYVLFNKKRSQEEEVIINEIKKDLNTKLGTAETDLEKLVEMAVNNALMSLTLENSSKSIEDSPAYFEIRRQLKNLFKTK